MFVVSSISPILDYLSTVFPSSSPHSYSRPQRRNRWKPPCQTKIHETSHHHLSLWTIRNPSSSFDATMNHSQSIQSSFFELCYFTIQPYKNTTRIDTSNHIFIHLTNRRCQAMYDENCFEVGSSMPRGRFASDASMCYEDRTVGVGKFLMQIECNWGIGDWWMFLVKKNIVNVSYEHLNISGVSFSKFIQYTQFICGPKSKAFCERWLSTLLQERVLYRLLSGWHASTSISIAKNYYAPGTQNAGTIGGLWKVLLSHTSPKQLCNHMTTCLFLGRCPV